MNHLFTRPIGGRASWGDVFCDADAFLPLARAIYAREGLPPPARLSGLTPGTNAVFRAGDTVVKIFAPEESGFNGAHDFAVERAALRFAAEAGVPVGAPVAFGCVEDAYTFRYILMEWVDAGEAGDVLPTLGAEQKEQFIHELKGLLRKLNRQPGRKLFDPIDAKERAINNPRLSVLPETLAADMRARARAADVSAPVFVHGDLTGENVLIRPDGGIVVIDFADSNIAPAVYEWPPIVFDLLRGERALVRAFIGDGCMGMFVDRLVTAVALHDFGAGIVLEDARRHGVPVPGRLSVYASMLVNRWK